MGSYADLLNAKEGGESLPQKSSTGNKGPVEAGKTAPLSRGKVAPLSERMPSTPAIPATETAPTVQKHEGGKEGRRETG